MQQFNDDVDTSKPVLVLDEQDLKSATDEGVTLVDFYADWCGPCKVLEPIVETLAEETDALVAKVDVDRAQTLAADFQVRGVPTLILFADGDPVERIVGVQPESELRILIEQYAA